MGWVHGYIQFSMGDKKRTKSTRLHRKGPVSLYTSKLITVDTGGYSTILVRGITHLKSYQLS